MPYKAISESPRFPDVRHVFGQKPNASIITNFVRMLTSANTARKFKTLLAYVEECLVVGSSMSERAR
jgi:hypothetical protein